MFTFIVISLSDCSFRAVLRNLSHPKIFKLLYSYMCLIIFFKYFNFDSSSLSQGAEVTKQTEPGLSGLVATGLPWRLSGREPACQCRRRRRPGFHPWVGKVSCRRAWQPTPVFLPGKSQGQRSLEGYSPWGLNDSDAT